MVNFLSGTNYITLKYLGDIFEGFLVEVNTSKNGNFDMRVCEKVLNKETLFPTIPCKFLNVDYNAVKSKSHSLSEIA